MTASVSAAAAEVASGIEVIAGQLAADASPDGNSVLIRGPRGLLLVDTGRGAAHTQALIRRIESAGSPLRGVFNTHWHLDHVGGNAAFRTRWPQVPIHAHPSLDAALEGFHADNRRQLESFLPTLPPASPQRPRLSAELALLRLGRRLAATRAVSAPTVHEDTGRAIEVHVAAHAVTEGDLWLLDRRTGTLIAGDLVTLPVPLFDSACPEGWRAALGDLAAARFERLVPGHGRVLGRAEFDTYRRGFERLLACAAGEAGNRACADGWFGDTASLGTDPGETYARELLDYYLDNFLRPAAPGRARWCEAAPAARSARAIVAECRLHEGGGGDASNCGPAGAAGDAHGVQQ